MAKVPYLQREDAADHLQALFDRLEAERRVPIPNVFLALTHAPEQLDAFLNYANSLRSCELGSRLRELVILTVGHTTGCHYEVAHHEPYALQTGLTREQLAAIPHAEASGLFEDFEVAVMRLTREFSAGREVTSESWDAVAAHLSTRQMVQLALTIAWYLSGALMMRMLDVELEPEYLTEG